MRILITGSYGQLGSALMTRLKNETALGVDLDGLDIGDGVAVGRYLDTMTPDVVINAAAFTNVDGCVRQPDVAFRANALGPHNLALACAARDIALVQVSSNEVFGGCKAAGYDEWDTAAPINAYGRSKAAGEFFVRQAWRKHYIVRLAWLFAPGGKNFVHTILRLAGKYGKVRVVTDEVGNPTYVHDLADAIARLIETQQYGTYHFTNAGACSRWDFANEVLRLAGLAEIENMPIFGSEFKRLSTPPAYCALNNSLGAAIGITLRPWQDALAAYFAAEENRKDE